MLIILIRVFQSAYILILSIFEILTFFIFCLGNVVGVTVAKLDYKFSMKNYSTIPELTNFGIKSSMVRSFLSASNIKFRNEVYKKIEN